MCWRSTQPPVLSGCSNLTSHATVETGVRPSRAVTVLRRNCLQAVRDCSYRIHLDRQPAQLHVASQLSRL